MSVGVAMCPRDGTEYDTLFEIADKRLYAAKEGGRNRVVDGRPKPPDGHVRLASG